MIAGWPRPGWAAEAWLGGRGLAGELLLLFMLSTASSLPRRQRQKQTRVRLAPFRGDKAPRQCHVVGRSQRHLGRCIELTSPFARAIHRWSVAEAVACQVVISRNFGPHRHSLGLNRGCVLSLAWGGDWSVRKHAWCIHYSQHVVV